MYEIEEMNKIDENTLPAFLKHDIDAYIEAIRKEQETGEKCWHMDCLQDEIYGSINGAYWDGLIDKDVAEYLREKYLGIDEPLQSREISKEDADFLRNFHRCKREV
ncbi:hypothetical protein SAMN05216245_11713 [Succiniclasticum ruminis DSM 9236]|uniref:Uncharacterized protein n=2 Tax=Succiniclasticum ruminis TaxID=40841 RepID=A0A1I2D5E8_9FIRM|nr:hypothetical protein SAMN05216245_11713 [Succiniclasticum ruminis DSM 9236]